jgi:hypothetical protein
MKTRNFLVVATLFALASTLTLAGCTADEPASPDTEEPGNDPGGDPTDDPEDDPNDPGDKSGYNPSGDIPAADTRDELPAAKIDATVAIVFLSGGATVSPATTSGVTVERTGADVTVRSTAENIEYRVSGTTADGSLTIHSDEPFSLTLADASITNPTGPAVNIQKGDYCFVTMADGTRNSLADGATYDAADEDRKACLFSEGTLVFGGGGSLAIAAKYKHAICSDDAVRIDGGAITVTGAASDAVHVNDSFVITGGSLTSTSAGDGVDCEAGFIAADGGALAITTTGKKGHALKSATNTRIDGGSHKLAVSGAASKGISTGGNAVVTGGETSVTTSGDSIVEDNDTTSPSGIKADGEFVMGGGKLTVLSTGKGAKAISADGDIRLLGGEIEATTTGAEYVSGALSTSPKAIKSDSNVYIKYGSCTITTTSEGLEAEYCIRIDGGTLDITAADDAINASAERTAAITINGGRVYAYSSGNDAIDSNGTFRMTGGVVVASGTGQPEGGVDCDQNSLVVTGGTLIATGGTTSYPTYCGSQHAIVYGATGSSGDWVQIKKTDGEQVLVYRVPRSYGGSMVMLVGDAGITKGAGYTVTRGGSYTGGTEQFLGYHTGGTYTGGTAVSGTMSSSAAYSSLGNSTGGGPGGGGGGNPGGRP